MNMLRRWIVILSLSSVLVYGNPTARNNEITENEIEDNISDLDIHSFAKCSYKDGITGVVNCAAMRALKILQQAIKRDSIEIYPGIALTSENLLHDREAKAIENESEVLSADSKDQTEQLFGLIIKAAGRFFSGRTLKIKLPEINATGLSRALEEGRGKMGKKGGMSPLLLGLGAKLLLLKALALAGLAFMSVKALVLSKIALVLAVIFGAQSLFGGAFNLKDFGSSNIGKHGWINGWTSGGGYGPSYGYGTPHHGWTTNNIGGWGNSQYPYARSIDNIKEDDLAGPSVDVYHNCGDSIKCAEENLIRLVDNFDSKPSVSLWRDYMILEKTNEETFTPKAQEGIFERLLRYMSNHELRLRFPSQQNARSMIEGNDY
ncbi:hypothetical protein ILUMI_06292 [Ignelater luminosus]|uniref:Uncharacterized protein n=1 Tax=Ignelater luminosus TaxID=2038154 RepID=A0A8K0GFI5_IGNLU|nr:hypothetical protein ILUMI_06292 [Ignelater luminosus]